MAYKLPIYTDDTFKTVKEVRECDELTIPFRVGEYFMDLLAVLDFNNDIEVLLAAAKSKDQIKKIIRASFGMTEDEFDFVKLNDLKAVAQPIIKFIYDKIKELNLDGDDDPNQTAPAI